MPTSGEVGINLKSGGYSGDMCPMEWKSSRAPSVTSGTDNLEHWELWVLVAHKSGRSHSYWYADRILIQVYELVTLGVLGPLVRVFLLYSITSVLT